MSRSAKSRALVPILVVAAAAAVGLAVRGQDAPATQERVLSPVARAIAKASPSVVRVELSAGTPLKDAPRRRLFRRVPNRTKASGLVLGPNLVLTHAVLGLFSDPRYVVTTPSGKRINATLLRLDRRRELALLETAEPLDAPVATTHPSRAVARGSLVLALGDPFGIARDAQATATLGILEGRVELDAVEASYRGEVLLTDAAINPGSEGGPLVDMHGRVIGLLAPLVQDRRVSSLGPPGRGGLTAYAIPIEEALQLIRPREPQAPPLGFRARAGALGLEVVTVAPKGVAAKAGLRPGDVIKAANDHAVRFGADLRRVTAAAAPPQGRRTVDLEVERGDETRRIVLEPWGKP